MPRTLRNPPAFAAFVVAPVRGGIAATTRAADRGEAGRIGLPGGKVDPGETEKAAALREAAEEGWAVRGPLRETHRALVEGREVVWFVARGAQRLASYKEQHRIRPVVATRAQIAASGYGNEWMARGPRTPHTSRTRRNPQWSWDLLDILLPRIQRAVPRSLWPIVINPRVKEFGGGYFGVAMPTIGGKWTCKITADGSEAAWACVAIQKHLLEYNPDDPLAPPEKHRIKYPKTGVVQFKHVFAVSFMHRRTQDGILVFPKGTSPYGPPARGVRDLQLYVLWRQTAELTGRAALDSVLGKEDPAASRLWWQHMQESLVVARDTLAFVSQGMPLAPDRLAFLREYQDHLSVSLATGVSPAGPNALIELAEQGVYTGDAHRENWGTVNGVLTVVDPGLCFFVNNATGTLRTPPTAPDLP